MARQGKGRYTAYWLLAPGAIWLLLFFVVPFYSLVSASLFDPNGSPLTGYKVTYHVANYWTVLKEYHSELLRSLGYAALATAICLVIGYVLAYAIAFKAGRWRNLLLVLVIAPFFTSFLLRTLSWKLILADHGFIVSTMQHLHLLHHDGKLLNTSFAVVAGIVYNFLPFMVLPLYASLEKIDGRLVEAAGDLYANPFTAFFRVTWPLSLPGVVAGTLLTFIPSAGDYVNAQLLGSPGNSMVGNRIQSLFTSTGDYAGAGALSMILMLLIIAMVLVYIRKAGTEELI